MLHPHHPPTPSDVPVENAGMCEKFQGITIFARSGLILRILSLGSAVIVQRWVSILHLAWIDMMLFSVFVLVPSFRTTILAKFVVNFVLNEGRIK